MRKESNVGKNPSSTKSGPGRFHKEGIKEPKRRVRSGKGKGLLGLNTFKLIKHGKEQLEKYKEKA
jgi:hypothetical protein